MTMFPGEFEDLISNAGIVDPHSETAAKLQSTTEALVSGVVAINRRAGLEPVKVRADLIELLETALYYAELSDGAFDPTIGPLTRLWGIGTDSERVPGEGEIARALRLVNWRDLIIDRESGTAFLRREGMALDLGAIAKGYAGDEALRIAKQDKVKRAVIDLGGNIVTLGGREKKGKIIHPWRIGIQNPLMGRGSYIGVIPVIDMSVVTSGVYERHFESGGKSYHHLLSTANGYPVENGLLSATIVTRSSTAADALSTLVFTLGYERGKAVIDSIPDTDAIFVFDDHSVRITAGLNEFFKLTDNEFTLLP
jgi:thiamine biosynthesis lipoprotein